MTPHYAFLLKQQLQIVDDVTQHIEAFDARIEASMQPFAEAAALVQTMPGIAQRAAQAIVAEIGDDMARSPSGAHLASWARVCPANNESAGKRRPAYTGKGNVWLRATLQEAAWSAASTKHRREEA
jgi:transposase